MPPFVPRECRRQGLSGLATWNICLLAAVCTVPQTSGICDFSKLHTSHESVALDEVVRWLPEEKQCMPDICSNLQLGDIPDLSGFLPASLFCALDMFDSAHALEHLRGKYMVLFGDSTMQENLYDLIILLSGISKDREAMDTFMNTSIWLPRQDSDFLMEVPMHGDATDQMLVTYHKTNRNATIRIPSHDILIRFRYSGHPNMDGDLHGVATFTEAAWLDDYRCMVEMLGSGCAPKHPDFLVFNTGAHDTTHSLDHFTDGMRRLASWLGEVQRTLPATRVIWRGNNAVGRWQGQESISRHFIEEEGIHFYDVHPFFATFQSVLDTDCCSDYTRHGGMHVGGIHKYFANVNRHDTRITISSLITQGLLGALFGHRRPCTLSHSYEL